MWKTRLSGPVKLRAAWENPSWNLPEGGEKCHRNRAITAYSSLFWYSFIRHPPWPWGDAAYWAERTIIWGRRFFGILTSVLEPQTNLHVRCYPQKVPFQASLVGWARKLEYVYSGDTMFWKDRKERGACILCQNMCISQEVQTWFRFTAVSMYGGE